MSFTEVRGNVIDVARKVAAGGREVLLPHVCNDFGVMGAGVARMLAQAFPSVDTEYARLCQSGDPVLGTTVSEHVEPHLFVMNMIAQAGFSNGGELPPLQYGALVHCMENVLSLARAHEEMELKVTIVAPRFGAGLAGGEWNVIRAIIHEIWVHNGVPVIICNYP